MNVNSMIDLNYVIAALFVSNLATLYFYFSLRKKLKNTPKKDSEELQEFLADLLNGDALVRVQRISPVNVFMRSPRGQ